MSLKENNSKSKIISYSDIASKKEVVEKNYDCNEELKSNGWCIIKREKRKVIIEKGKDLQNCYLRNNKNNNNNNSKKILNSMINNWNKFRDEQNDLYGDLSLYINYEEEIRKLVEEEERILEEMALRENNDSDSDYQSDNERF
jgi:hypothetical protein